MALKTSCKSPSSPVNLRISKVSATAQHYLRQFMLFAAIQNNDYKNNTNGVLIINHRHHYILYI